MFRISALSCLALAIALGTGSAFAARNCDERVVGSCAAEPIAEPGDANAAAAEATQAALSARSGRERSYKRARLAGRSFRYSRRAERRAERRTERRKAVVVRAARRQVASAEPEADEAQIPAPRQVVATAPEAAPILPPAFTQTQRPEAGNVGAATPWPTQSAEVAAPAVAVAAAPTPPAAAAPPTADASQQPANPAPRVAATPPEQPDGSWMRVVFVALGGLLAAGSVVRLFV